MVKILSNGREFKLFWKIERHYKCEACDFFAIVYLSSYVTDRFIC